MNKKTITIEDLRKNHPNTLTVDIVADFLDKGPLQIRKLAKEGLLPFAIVQKVKHNYNYTFPTERFIAWLEGRLNLCERPCLRERKDIST